MCILREFHVKYRDVPRQCLSFERTDTQLSLSYFVARKNPLRRLPPASRPPNLVSTLGPPKSPSGEIERSAGEIRSRFLALRVRAIRDRLFYGCVRRADISLVGCRDCSREKVQRGGTERGTSRRSDGEVREKEK